MAGKTTFVANKSAAKSNSTMNKETESRIKTLRAQAAKMSKTITKNQKLAQKKLSGK